MRIQWLLPGVEISGGVICVLRHAAGLQQHGHQVSVFVAQPFDRSILDLFPADVRSIDLQPVPAAIPEAEIQIATHYTTVLPVAQAPARLRAHFVQHVETIFALDHPSPQIVLPFIRMAYTLPVYRIANSSWARVTLARVFGYHADLALNAGAGPTELPPSPDVTRPVVVVSFVHEARWKGTTDAYHALVLARALAPEWDIQWHVFGGGAAPSAPWVHHHGLVAYDGFPALYRQAAVVLFTSWAESYPLPPLEAMAAGAVVVTTPFGLEDYVKEGVNALVVPPRDPRAAANAVLAALGAPVEQRRAWQEAGQETARRQTWDAAVLGFEQALERGLNASGPIDPRSALLEELGIPVTTG